MLKTLGSTDFSTQPRKGGVGVGVDSRTGRDNGKLDESRNGDNEVDDEIDDEVGKKGRNPTKSKNFSKSKKTKSGFLISVAKRAFTKLR